MTGIPYTFPKGAQPQLRWQQGKSPLTQLAQLLMSRLKISTGDLCEIGTVPEGRWKWHGAALAEERGGHQPLRTAIRGLAHRRLTLLSVGVLNRWTQLRLFPGTKYVCHRILCCARKVANF